MRYSTVIQVILQKSFYWQFIIQLSLLKKEKHNPPSGTNLPPLFFLLLSRYLPTPIPRVVRDILHAKEGISFLSSHIENCLQARDPCMPVRSKVGVSSPLPLLICDSCALPGKEGWGFMAGGVEDVVLVRGSSPLVSF